MIGTKRNIEHTNEILSANLGNLKVSSSSIVNDLNLPTRRMSGLDNMIFNFFAHAFC